MKHKRKHIRRRFRIWHGIVALLLLLFVFFHVSGRLKLNKQVQILRTKGYPVTLDELQNSYSLPQGVRNAADVYLAAFSNYEKWDSDAMRTVPIVGRADLPARTELLESSTRQLAGRFLSDNQQTLSLLHEAASIEHCRYPIDFAQQSDPNASLQKDMRAAVQLLGLEAFIASEDKDADKFLDSISASLALARSVDGPLLTHRLTHDAIMGYAYRSIERAINRMPLTDEQLSTLSGWVKVSDSSEGFKRALLAEQCLGLHTFTAPLPEVSNRINEQEKGLFRVLIISRMLGLNSKYALSYIKLMQKSIDALELPDPDRLETFNAIQENIHSGKQGGVITDLIWPALARTLQLDIRHQAHARVTQAGLAIERYRLAEGHLPQSLDNLVPDFLQTVPEDPFNGENLRYRNLKNGFVVYSVGEDLTDEGGAERDSRKRDPSGKPLPWDITFIVER
jgi:hypothetical protein